MTIRLTHLMDNRVVIARRIAVTGDKMAYVTVTAEMMNIQPVGDSSSEISEGTFGKQFIIYCDGNADLSEGDRLADENGNTYTIQADGVTRRTMGSMDFIVAVIQKTNT